MVPPDLAARGEHAYVVEYRAADACAPPRCLLDGRAVHGNASVRDRDGKPGGYVVVGNDHDEMFAKRGLVLPAHGSLSWTLPASDRPSSLDLDVASADPRGGAFRIAIEIESGGDRLFEKTLAGTTPPYAAHAEIAELGREERYFVHDREALPSREERAIVVSIRNQGDDPVGIGAPLVLSRVEGRGPRHAIFVFFDAVPHPLLEQLFTQTTDAKTRWLSHWIESDGLFYPEGRSPGQLTGSFVRRFFKADFFRLDGEPSLLGQGFDENPPERAPGPVARLAEQGFVTVAVGSNLYLSPVLSRIGFDSAYNIESTIELQVHPPVLARRFDDELAKHAEDDAFFVVWYANTHMPWREGRKDAPPVRQVKLGQAPLDVGVLEPVWRNLLQSADSLQDIHESAARRAGTAERLWVIGTDHGHTFTERDRDRPWRLTRETFERGHMHCCLATEQEARTPFVILSEGGHGPRGVVEAPQSSMVAWRALERRFGVDLDLPKTSAFALPGDPAPFEDGIVVSVGNSNALSGRSSEWSYRSYQPALDLSPIWSVPPAVALLLAGSPLRAGDVVAEELYDLRTDPAEQKNLADARFEELLGMRDKMANWLAEYADTPDHPRYRYLLRFGRSAPREIDAPRPFLAAVDGNPAAEARPPLHFLGDRIELEDGAIPLGVIDLHARGEGPLLVRCASSGLPLDALDERKRRVNVVVARTNCVGAGEIDASPRAGEILFSATRVSLTPRGADSGAKALPELHNALRRWGYVRDK